MANPWFRLYSEFMHDPKVQKMEEKHQRRLVMILCMRCNGSVTLQDEDVTFVLRISDEEWRESKSLFIAQNFISEDGFVLNWDKRQYSSDSSRERVARHREKQKRVTITDSNVTVTVQNRTDTEQNRTENTNTSLPASPKADNVPYEKIVSLYHEKLPTLPKVVMLTTKRKGQIAARWKSGVLPDLETWENYFDFVSKSPFLMGLKDPPEGRKRFVADLEWITNESNFTKIWEKKYHGQV